MGAAEVDYLVNASAREPWLIREELLRLDAEERLIDFMRLMWPVLHPRRPLVVGWALECLCEHLEAVHRGEIQQLQINIPPGLTKSLTVDVMFPAWEWGPRARPDLSYLSFSYSSELTIRDNRKCRQLLLSPLYQRLWGDRFRLSLDQNTKEKFANDHSGQRYASSVGGPGTGERADRIIIDDAHKVSQVESERIRTNARRWLSNEIVTRINEEGSAFILIGQRTHLQDIYGMILKEGLAGDWLCLPMEFEARNRCFTTVPRAGVEPESVALVHPTGESIPRWVTPSEADEAIRKEQIPAFPRPEFVMRTCQDPRTREGQLLAPERFSRDFVENRLKRGLRMEGGNYAIAAQLQQRPSPREGAAFKLADFKVMDRAPAAFSVRVRGWDLAGTAKKTSPHTACVRMGLSGTDVVIDDARRIQKESREVYEFIQQVVILDGPGVIQDFPQDPGQAGKDQRRHILRVIRAVAATHPELAEVLVRFSPETGSKEVRAGALASEGQAGTLWIVRGDWNGGFIDECLLFPVGDFADQVDAASRAYARVIRENPEHAGPVWPEEIRGE